MVGIPSMLKTRCPLGLIKLLALFLLFAPIIPVGNYGLLSLARAEFLEDYVPLEISVEGTHESSQFRGVRSETEIPSVDEIQANHFFETVKRLSEVQFSTPIDGCYARAHVISARMLENGIWPQKIWILRDDDKIHPKDAPSVFWDYHVAPLILVRNEEGKVVNKVIDPHLGGEKLLFIDEWLEKMSFRNARLVLTSYLPYQPKGDGRIPILDWETMGEQNWKRDLAAAQEFFLFPRKARR